MTPFLLINFKTYKMGTGREALELAKTADKVASETGSNIILSVQSADIRQISKAVSVPVFAQNIDPIKYGSHTGWSLAEAVAEAGAKGTLINHSEHQSRLKDIEKSINRCRETGLIPVCCAATPAIAEKIAAFSPDFISIEPPELIGGTVSVSKARPELIEDTVRRVHKVNPDIEVLCGAGVGNREDVEKAVELGARGVLVASAIVKSGNPGLVMKNLIKGFG
ncbi:MAG: triose-phosphate isomerase [Candidatus Aenigmarchaeota archaeon]|nr:triose-phosphate isomerase [Candidatus Aenigmarchaeota archaeon]